MVRLRSIENIDMTAVTEIQVVGELCKVVHKYQHLLQINNQEVAAGAINMITTATEPLPPTAGGSTSR